MDTPLQMFETDFGALRLFECIGQGGMAAVYRGELHQMQGVVKRVAVKVIHAHLTDEDPSFAKWFVSEARLGALLEHANVVRTYQLTELEGRLCLILEYVDGVSLSFLLQHLRWAGARFPVPVALDIIIQICQGLHYAHLATDHQERPLNLVHRDLKPANILIDHLGCVKIGDFGVARASTNVTHTQGPALKGTIRYMSPEQANWLQEVILDRRSDLFSVGIILYEVLSSEYLYNGRDMTALGRQAVQADVAGRLEQLPSDLAGRDALIRVLSRALARDRETRYQSAEDFAEALREVRFALPQRLSLQKWLRDKDIMASLRAVDAGRPRDVLPIAEGTGPSLSLQALEPSGWEEAEGLGRVTVPETLSQDESGTAGQPGRPPRGDAISLPETMAPGNGSGALPEADLAEEPTAGLSEGLELLRQESKPEDWSEWDASTAAVDPLVPPGVPAVSLLKNAGEASALRAPERPEGAAERQQRLGRSIPRWLAALGLLLVGGWGLMVWLEPDSGPEPRIDVVSHEEPRTDVVSHGISGSRTSPDDLPISLEKSHPLDLEPTGQAPGSATQPNILGGPGQDRPLPDNSDSSTERSKKVVASPNDAVPTAARARVAGSSRDKPAFSSLMPAASSGTGTGLPGLAPGGTPAPSQTDHAGETSSQPPTAPVSAGPPTAPVSAKPPTAPVSAGPPTSSKPSRPSAPPGGHLKVNSIGQVGTIDLKGAVSVSVKPGQEVSLPPGEYGVLVRWDGGEASTGVTVVSGELSICVFMVESGKMLECRSRKLAH